MKFVSLLLIAALSIAAPTIHKREKASDWDYENDKIHGVNLGGWFLLEPYITPSLFDAFKPGEIPVDDYHYHQFLGKDEAKRRLEHHWDTWYQESDFEEMANAGINTVRIPIGYWAYGLLPDDPYVQGQDFYLERALGWARNHGINAWIDLHGVPGSQNGGTSSGKRGSYDSMDEFRESLGYQRYENVALTLTVLQRIFDKYGGPKFEDVISGIQFMNEPLGPASDMTFLKNFYTWAYGNMRFMNGISYNNVILSDAFQEEAGYWDDFMTLEQGYWDVVLDHHHYRWRTPEDLAMSVDEHMDVACENGRQHMNEYHWNVVGEWSGAMTDCARWLNGVGHGSRWTGDFNNPEKIGSCEPYTQVDQWTDEHRKDLRRFIEGQIDAYSTASGWLFWNWKTEDAIEWSMSDLIKEGVFPQPFDDRQFPPQCDF